MNTENLKNYKIAILGFGKEGLSTYKFLKKHGVENITILDNKDISLFSGESENILKKENCILGDKYLQDLDKYDYIVKSPGISPYLKELSPFKNKFLSQTQLFFDNYKGKVIAVTGTKGKSTTASLIYEVLKNVGFNVGIVGNIGNPVLDYIENSYDFVIFEMSSYMLEGVLINPYMSVIVNIYEEHLDYHNGFENYKQAKLNIIGKDSIIIYNHETRKDIKFYKNRKISFGNNGEFYVKGNYFYNDKMKLYDIDGVKLIGQHNLINICAVNIIANLFNIHNNELEKIIKNFKGLPHRLEFIGEKKGINFYDDAISTTPESTIVAIESFGNKLETIFLGGSDRGYNFKDLAKIIVNSKIKNIVFFKDTGARIKQEISNIVGNFDEIFSSIETSSMQEAVQFAFDKTGEGKICLLSCASPSYSLWKNFEEKGDEFKKWIEKLGS